MASADIDTADGEDLSDTEELSITVDFLKLKSLAVIKALKKIIPKDIRDDRGNTLLHWAAHRGQLEKTKYLAETWLSSPEAVNSAGENALEVASRAGHIRVIEHLVSLGLSCEVKDPQERLNPVVSIPAEQQLSLALYADNVEVLSQLWPAYVTNPQGRFSLPEHYESTLLELTANFLSPRALEFLILKGCSLASECKVTGFRPIHTLLSTFLANLPPEDDAEWTRVNSGCDCMLLITSMGLDMSDYTRLVEEVKKRLGLVGEYVAPCAPFERQVVLKVDRLRGLLR